MKKTKFKRIIALICSITMLFSLMCVNVSAEYTITGTTGSFTINKTNGAGNKAISGVIFKSIKVADMVQYSEVDGTTTTTQLAFYLTAAGKAIFTNIDDVTPIKTGYDIGGGTTVDLYSATDLQSCLDALSQTTLVSTMNTFTATDGVMTLETAAKTGIASSNTVPIGIYIVVESDNSKAYVGESYSEDTAVVVESAAAPYLVAIPQTDPNDATKWIYDVTTTPKNIIKATDATKSIVVTKEKVVENGSETTTTEMVTEMVTKTNEISVGETVDFLITAAIASSDDHQYSSYEITDTATGFIYDTTASNIPDFATITLHDFNDSGDPVDTVLYEATSGTARHYVVTFSGNSSFKIEFLNDGLALLNNVNSENAYITIKYSGKLNAAGSSTNSAKITYNYGGENIPDDPPPVEIDTYKITLNKYFDSIDGVTPTVADVKFKLSTDEAGQKIIYTKAANAAGHYTADISLTSGPTEMAVALNTGVADSTQGILVIDGLADGTYYLTEVATSDGYGLLKEPIKVTISGGDVTLDVTNKKSTIFNLPVTGGLGSLVYTAIGIGCICLAIFMVTKLSRKKRFQ